MKIRSVVFALLLLVLGCRPARKVQKIQEAISKSDTTATVVVKNNQSVDSAAANRNEIYKKVTSNVIRYKTFSAKVRVEYDGKDGGDEAIAFIRLQKDSVMWLSLRGPLGIEGFRVLITKDSAKVMNLLKKSYQLRSIGYLQEITKLPFNFTTLQDLVVGNPIFIDSNIVSYKANTNNQLLVLMIGKVFKHLITLDNSTNLLVHSKLDDVDASRNRTSSISFTDYQNTAGFPFSTKRRISVAEQSKLDINLDFKQYDFNKPLTFPFTIPKNYKRQ
ncbi:MAG: hypothetical protein JWQ96_1613 [Segetibacter sp.]|nr:hypothetical protein [Segetibacter sp.]